MPGETETTLRDKLGSSAGTSAWTSGGGSSNYNHGTGQNSQNQNQNQDVKPKKEHKLLTALKELQAAGKGTLDPGNYVVGKNILVRLFHHETKHKHNYYHLLNKKNCFLYQ